MARYPGATWRPVAWANARDDNTDATVVVLHVTAGLANSQYAYFNEVKKACSHFHVALDGDVEQYIDTDKLSAADYEGSDDSISIETAGLGDGEWTPAQIVSLVKLLAWIARTHGIPMRLKTTSSPTEAGVGWHRLGIVGNFPSLPSLLAGRNQRGYAGEAWSLSTGKICPGDKRILQIPALVAAAGGASPKETFLMALSDDKQEIMFDKVATAAVKSSQAVEKLERIENAADARRELDLKYMRASAQREAAALAEVTALSGALKAFAENVGVDGDALVEAVKAAAREALSGITFTATTKEI